MSEVTVTRGKMSLTSISVLMNGGWCDVKPMITKVSVSYRTRLAKQTFKN